EAIPEPQPPKKEEPPREKPAPPPPELVVYPITKADPVAAQGVLAKMIPNATIQYDAKRAQFYVYATPNEQATVAKVLDNLEADLPPEQHRTLEIYSVKEAIQRLPAPAPAPAAAPLAGSTEAAGTAGQNTVTDSHGRPRYRIDAYGRRIPLSPEERAAWQQNAAPPAASPGAPAPPVGDSFLVTLQELVPAAELHLDRTSARLTAFATAEEHETIKAMIEKLGSPETVADAPLVEVYAITHSDPDSLKTMFESLFAGVQVNVDKSTSSMVIFAYPSEHKLIKETLDRLMPPTAEGAPGGNPRAAELRFYPLKDSYPGTLQSVLAGLVPNALVTYDTSNNRLIVVGSAADHELIGRGVEQLETAKAEDRSKLVVYPVTPLQKSRFTSVLESLVSELPGVVLVPGSGAGELAIWASALHHETIASILKQFEGEGGAGESGFQMVAYPVKATDPMTLEHMLEDLFPGLRMLVDRRGAKLLVWATAAEHEQVKKSIASIVSGPPPEEQPRFATYTIRTLARRSQATLNALERQLSDLAPAAHLTLDSETGELIVWGTPEEQTLVETAMERLGQGDAPENAPSLKVYPLEDIDATTAQALVTQLVRGAQVSLDAKGNQLMAMATPADQEVIRKTLEELAASRLPENAPQVRFHTLQKAAAADALAVLHTIVPKAEVTVESATGRLMVVASPADQEKVVATIASIEEGSDSKAELRFHELQDSLPPTVLALLAELAPKAKINPDPENNRLMVVAGPEDQEKVAKTIAQVEEAGSTRPELRFYPITDELPAAVTLMLERLAPKAQITPDPSKKYLSVVASPADHEIIQSTLEKVATTLPAEEKEKLAVYPVTPQQQTRFQAILASVQAELPSVKVIAESTPGQLSIWARPSEHEVLAQILEELRQDLPPEQKYQLVAYSLKTADPTSVTTVLGELFPNTRVTLDAASNRLMIWTAAEEHDSIRRALEQIDVETPPAEQRRFEVYVLGGVAGLSGSGRAAKATGFLENLRTLVPNVRLTIDPETGNLVAFATPSEHEIIRTAVEKLGQFTSAAYTPQLEVHELTSADPTSTMTILNGMVPRAEITLDAANKRLVVLAPPDAQVAIRNTLAQLQSADPGANDPQARVIPLKQKASPALSEVLSKLAPEATVTVDEDGRRLVVVATEADHKRIERTVQEIDGVSGEGRENALMVYPVAPGERRRFEAVVEALAEDLPGVKVIQDEQPTQLSVWARPAEHRMIGEILAQLKAGGGTDDQKRFEAYSIQGAVGYEPSQGGRLQTATTLMAGIQELVPGAKLMIDTKNDKLVAWASPEEHEMLKAAVESLAPTSGDNAPQLQVHMLKKRAAENLVDGLKQLAPSAKISIDSEFKRLTVVGNAADQQVIQSALDKIQWGGGEDGEPYFEIYPVAGIPAANEQMAGRSFSSSRYYAARSFADQLEPFAPGAEITIDYEKGNLMVLGTAKEHAAIKAAIEKLAPNTGANAMQLQVHMLKKRAPENLVDGLKKLAPNAQIAIDTEFKRLTVVGNAADQQAIQSALDKIQSGGGEDGDPYFEIYPVAGIPASTEQFAGRGFSSGRYYASRSFADQLEPFAPGAEITIDYEKGNLLVLGTAKEHAAIKAAIAKLQAGGQNTPELQIYTLKNEVPETLSAALTQLLPHAKINVDPEARQVSVVAVAADHKVVKETLDKIDQAAGEKEKPFFKVYAVTAIRTDPQYSSSRYYAAHQLMEQLQEFVPSASISIDFTTGNLLVFGTQEEHTKIESAITGLTGTGSAENPATVAVYRLNNADERAVFQLLQNLVPKARLSFDYRTDSIMAFATAEDHELIKGTIAQLDLGAGNPNAPELRFHTLQQAPPRNLIDGLEELAPKAEITYDPASRQLMVIATAAEHAIIDKNLSQIEETAAAESKDELVVYTIESGDMEAVQTVLEDLYPGIRIQPDAKNDRIMVTALPAQHEKIAAAIEKMDGGRDGGSEKKTVAYSVNEVDAATAIQILKTLAEDMELHPDASGTKILAFGRQRDHEIVAEAIEQMENGPDESHKPYLMVYPSGDADTTTLTQLLQNLAPKAKVVVDADSQTLAVFATAKDQEEVRSAIESMAVTAIGAGKPTAVTYALKKISVESATQILRLAVPAAQVAVGGDLRQLIVWANGRDQATVKSTLEAVDVESPEGARRTAAVYALEGINPNYSYYSMRLIRDAVPTASMTLGADPTQVVVWATPEDHETIRELVKSIVEQPPELEPVMEVYPLDKVDALAAIKILQAIVRDAALSVGANAGQLVAWARPRDQEKIKEALAKLTEADASPTAPTMEIYKLESGDAVSAITALRSVVPEAELTVGKDAAQLIAWARPADHEKIKAAVAKIDAAGPKPTMKIYTLDKLEALSVLRMLRSVVPGAVGEIGADSRQLVVWAGEEDHVKVDNAVKEMSAAVPDGKTMVAVTYELTSLTATTAEEVLKELAPGAKFVVGEDEYQLIIWARPDEHTQIEETLQRIDAAGPGGSGGEKAVIYELEGDGRQLFYMGRFLEQVVPKARFSPGVNPNQLVAWARPKDHEQIKELIEQLSDKENALQAVVYDAGNVPALTVTSALRQMIPEAVITPGAAPSELVVWTDPKSHEKVQQVIEKLKADDTPEKRARAVTYSLEEISVATAMQILRLAVPQAQVSPGTETYQLLVWGRPEDQKKVEETLKQVDVPGPEDKEAKAVAYKLDGTTAIQSYYILQFLAQSVPTARFTMGVSPDQIIAWAQPKVHEEVAELIKQIQGGEENAPKAVVYKLKNTPAAVVAVMLRQMAPGAIANPGTDPYELVVWARGDEHQKIRNLVDELSAPQPPETAPVPANYIVEKITAATAMTLLQAVVPQAKLGPGADLYQFVAVASPEDHEQIKAMLAKIDVDGPEDKMAKLAIYDLKNTTAVAALAMVRQIAPTALTTTGANPYQMIVWARPDEHEKIQKAVDQMAAQDAPEKAFQAVTYTLEEIPVATATQILQLAV
ncbi:MAG: hypothetical protein ACYC6Y_11865, partial [Thermoguttaceae bacterium]